MEIKLSRKILVGGTFAALISLFMSGFLNNKWFPIQLIIVGYVSFAGWLISCFKSLAHTGKRGSVERNGMYGWVIVLALILIIVLGVYFYSSLTMHGFSLVMLLIAIGISIFVSIIGISKTSDFWKKV